MQPESASPQRTSAVNFMCLQRTPPVWFGAKRRNHHRLVRSEFPLQFLACDLTISE